MYRHLLVESIGLAGKLIQECIRWGIVGYQKKLRHAAEEPDSKALVTTYG
jgi:hypothetical protein